MPATSSPDGSGVASAPWQSLKRRPLPHGHGALRDAGAAKGGSEETGKARREAQYEPGFAMFSKRVNSPRNVSGTMPIGPLRCLAMMISAMPLSCVSGL